MTTTTTSTEKKEQNRIHNEDLNDRGGWLIVLLFASLDSMHARTSIRSVHAHAYQINRQHFQSDFPKMKLLDINCWTTINREHTECRRGDVGEGGLLGKKEKKRREEKRTEKSMRRKIKEENWKERVRATKSELDYTLLNYAQPCAVLCYGVVCAPITVFDADFFFRCLSIYIISTFFLCVCMVLLYMSLSTPVHFISPDLCINGSHICVFE